MNVGEEWSRLAPGVGNSGVRKMSVSPEILNEALCAYVATFPVRERLDEHIRTRSLEAIGSEIIAALDGVLSAAEEFLFAYPGGVPWTEAFKQEFRQHLANTHVWLDPRGFASITSFSRWLCWHDGLNAEGA